MKTERRHNLETNELALRMTHWIEKTKPYLPQIYGAVAVLLGVVVVSSLWSSHSESRQQAAWDAYALAVDTTDPELLSLQRVASEDQYAGTPMQEWAYVTWADRQLLLAAQTYLIDRDRSKDRMRRVTGIYEELAASAGDRQVQNRARFGLARIYEMQNRLDEARRQYGLVQGDLAPLASDRAQELDSPHASAVYAWLDSAKLPQPTRSGEQGAPGSRPDFEVTLPSESSDNAKSDTRTLEDILGSLDEDSADDDRYSEEDDKEVAEENSEATDGGDSADDPSAVESTESDSPEDNADSDSPEQETSEP